MKKAIYTLLINWYQASDKPLPAWLDNACRKDATLARERDIGDELTNALKKRPNEASPSASDSMAARVMRQITEEDYLAEKESADTASASPWGAWLRTAGYGVAAVALVAVSIHFLNTPNENAVVDGPSAVVTNDPDEVAEDLRVIGESWKNPLDQEIEYIVSDAKGALGFIASSFVPSNYLKKSNDNGNA